MSYFDQCLPKIVKIDDGSGLAITRASLAAMTPDEFAALDNQEDLQRVYANATEKGMRGATAQYLDALWLGRAKNFSGSLRKTPVSDSQSIIAPFITFKQRSNVNAGYFEIESGVTVAGGYHWTVTVKNNSAWYQTLTSAARIDRFFKPGKYVYVLAVLASGAASQVAMKIISVADATALGVVKATVVLEPNVTSTGDWAGYTAAEKLPFQPTAGLLIIGTNSVSNYESDCVGIAPNLSLSLIHFWLQTNRSGFTVNSEYVKAIQAKNANEFWKVFKTMPVSEQVQQMDAVNTRELYHTLMFGGPINEYQNVNDWQDTGKLPDVVDILETSAVIEKKANVLGIEYQLALCNRVVDFAGQPLNFNTLGESLYQMLQYRKADRNSTTDNVLVMQTDRFTASLIQQMHLVYWKAKFGVEYRHELDANAAIGKSSGISFRSYEFPDWDLTLDVVVDNYFNDLLSAAPAAHRGAVRYAWFLDYSDIDWGVVQTRKVQREYPPRQGLPEGYKCVIDYNEAVINLESMKFTVCVYRPERSLIIKNFSTACPVSPLVTTCSAYTG